MRKTIKNNQKGEKSFLKVSVILFLLLGFILFNAFESSAQKEKQEFDPCDVTQFVAVSRTAAQLSNAQSNVPANYSFFDILRNGEKDLYIQIITPLPQNTVLKAFLNGAEIGTMERFTIQGQERWILDLYGADSPIVKVGALIEIKKDGEPFLSGSYTRQQYNWGQIGGFLSHQVGNIKACSSTIGFIYLPNSPFPRFLLVYPRVLTPVPVTRITVNEPSQNSGTVGVEVANVPIVSSQPSSNVPGWFFTKAQNEDIGLTEAQYQKLRQGLLSVNVFTASHPDGFSQMQINTFEINVGGDFEGDGQADLALFRPSDQNWYLLFSSNNQFQSVHFGLPTDKLVIGDYDSDGKADITTFQADNPNYQGLGVWQILNSSNNQVTTIQWGFGSDIPLSMNIDHNNTSDLTVFRPSNGTWYIRRMGDIIKPITETPENINLNYRIIQWGTAGDKPLAGDFNGDRIDELVIFRPSSSDWYIYNPVDGNYRIIHWGTGGDIPIAKDFDGDAKADVAVYRPSNGTWYILGSLDNSLIARQFGLSDDIPVPGDFDKDGVSDIAVYRPADGTWYVTRSSDNSFFAAQFGLSGDIPALAQR